MCDVTALAIGSFALDAGSKIAGAGAQNKAAKANKDNALASLRLQNADLSARQREENAAAATTKQSIVAQGTANTSTAAVSAAESGVEGGSVDALMRSLMFEQGQAVAAVDQNLGMTTDQIERQRRDAALNTNNRIASVQGANPLATGLGVAGAGLSLATQLKKYSLRGS